MQVAKIQRKGLGAAALLTLRGWWCIDDADEAQTGAHKEGGKEELRELVVVQR
jgi:protein tyrosine/serine phosphatase